MKANQKIGIGLASGVIGVSGILGATALANAQTESPTAPSSSVSTDTDQSTNGGQSPQNDQNSTDQNSNQGGRHGGRGGDMGGKDQMIADLASKLGVDESTLQTAMDKVREANKPAEGSTPTQPTEADRASRQDAMAQALATELGIDKSKVTDAMNAMESERQASHEAELKSTLDEAVSAGKISQSDADAVVRVQQAGVQIGGGHGPR